MGLERELDTPAHIYYTYEGGSPAAPTSRTRPSRRRTTTSGGGHAPGTETGAGSGHRARLRGSLFGLEVKVFMVKVSFEQKPYRRSFINLRGSVVASPSTATNAGARSWRPTRTRRQPRDRDSARPSRWPRPTTTRSTPGARPQHVLLHQTVIGRRRSSDGAGGGASGVVIGCAGGGRTSPASPSLHARRLNGTSRPASWPSSPRHAHPHPGEYR